MDDTVQILGPIIFDIYGFFDSEVYYDLMNGNSDEVVERLIHRHLYGDKKKDEHKLSKQI